MKNTKLVEEAKLNPTRIYHRPHDVLRDRRLKDPERLEILAAWEDGVRRAEPAGAQMNGTSVRLEDLEQVRREVEQRLPMPPT
jgi:hypothetical protein